MHVDKNTLVKFHPKLKMNSYIKETMIDASKPPKKKVQNKKRPKEEIIPNSNKDNRLKAYSIITKTPYNINYKGSGYQYRKEESKETQESQEEESVQVYKGPGRGINFAVVEEKLNIEKINDEYLIDLFEQYYEEKFKPFEKRGKGNKGSKMLVQEGIKTKDSVEKYYDIKMNYYLGATLKETETKNNLMCYHKEDKWVAYLNGTYIVVENFHYEKFREQIILNDHKSKQNLSSIKLSNGGRVLYAASTHNKLETPPEIFFYNYNRNKKFDYVNKYLIKGAKKLNDYSISPMNNMCVVLYDDFFISNIDFGLGEELMTTKAESKLNKLLKIEWNYYLSILEFCTINTKSFSIWTVSPKELKIKEAQSRVILFGEKDNSNTVVAAVNFTPPLTVKCIICLVIALSNGSICLVDYKKDIMLKKYTAYELFLYDSIKFTDLIISMYFITVVYENKIKYYSMPLLGEIQYDDIELFKNPKGEIEHESKVISCDIDLMKSRCEGMTLTQGGGLYYINYAEECTVSLFHFVPPSSKIIQCKLINKNIRKFSVQDMSKMQKEEKNEEGYYLITGHEDNSIRIWSVPDYNLLYCFESKDEIKLIQTLPNDLKFLAFFASGNVRSFDIENGKVLGKINIKSVLGKESYFKIVKFFPVGKFFFCLEDKTYKMNLGTIESLSPLIIHFNQLPIDGNLKVENFEMSLLDPYNKFYINDENESCAILQRKFTNLMQDLSFEKSVPQFGVIDSVDIRRFCEGNSFKKETNRKIISCYFSPLKTEKDVIYIFTGLYNLIIQRDFKMRIVTKIIKFDSELVNFRISNNADYIFYYFDKLFKVTEFIQYDITKPPKATIIPYIIKNPNQRAIFSTDYRFVVFYNETNLNFYEISNN